MTTPLKVETILEQRSSPSPRLKSQKEASIRFTTLNNETDTFEGLDKLRSDALFGVRSKYTDAGIADQSQQWEFQNSKMNLSKISER